jgi:hypothetical protein
MAATRRENIAEQGQVRIMYTVSKLINITIEIDGVIAMHAVFSQLNSVI